MACVSTVTTLLSPAKLRAKLFTFGPPGKRYIIRADNESIGLLSRIRRAFAMFERNASTLGGRTARISSAQIKFLFQSICGLSAAITPATVSSWRQYVVAHSHTIRRASGYHATPCTISASVAL